MVNKKGKGGGLKYRLKKTDLQISIAFSLINSKSLKYDSNLPPYIPNPGIFWGSLSQSDTIFSQVTEYTFIVEYTHP